MVDIGSIIFIEFSPSFGLYMYSCTVCDQILKVLYFPLASVSVSFMG